jgi:acetyl esterase/lipase
METMTMVTAGRIGRAAATLLASTALAVFGVTVHARDAPTAVDYLKRVDPELRALASQMPKGVEFTSETLPAFRAAPIPEPGQDPPFFKKMIQGLAGQPDVSIVVVNAKAGASRPGILHTHGGGYVLGSAEQYLGLIQMIAKRLDVTIVSVNYRRAPETTWKGSVLDNYAGLKWMYDHASELGVDRGRLAVMGESAGGGHAALLAIEARNRGEVPLVLQVLVCPMLDDRTGTSRTPAPDTGRLIWTARDNRFGWRSFLGVEPGTNKVSGGVPARVKNLAALPPAFIGVGGIDLFVEEDIAYALRLIEAGVPVDLHVYPGGYHGFHLLVPDAAVSKQFNAELESALRRGLKIGEQPVVGNQSSGLDFGNPKQGESN